MLYESRENRTRILKTAELHYDEATGQWREETPEEHAAWAEQRRQERKAEFGRRQSGTWGSAYKGTAGVKQPATTAPATTQPTVTQPATQPTVQPTTTAPKLTPEKTPGVRQGRAYDFL